MEDDLGPGGLSASSVLFPRSNERADHENRLTDALLEAGRRVRAGRVTPRYDDTAFRERLAGFDFETPVVLSDLLSWTIEQLESGITQVTNPRYFGLFNPSPAFPAQCADRIASAFNPQLATATTSPVAVAIEKHAIRALAGRVGYPAEAGGHFTTGGAEANYTAMICALTAADPRFAEGGARALLGPPVFYTSRESHLAWFKIALQAGIGHAAVRLVPTDGGGRLNPVALARMIEADRQVGALPVMLVATAGTTNAGMIDPLDACATIAKRHGLWLHVDAAWAGALIASARLRGALDGIEKADSLTIDAHKWFAATMGCGMFITRHPEALTASFQVSAGYMPSNNSSDPYVTTMQWSRRFVGLRFFLSLANAGWCGYARHVERAVALADLLKQKLLRHGWNIVNDSVAAVLCLRPPGDSPDAATIVKRVLASGHAWVSLATFEGEPVIRACITHGETSVEDITALVAALETCRQDDLGDMPA